jgi:D-glycero-D-manno-heptose 1,7-bisphosphate phosphatase
MAGKAIFLDRDDTIIEDSGYISSPEKVKLLPTSSAALIELRKMGYKLVVVTNQSGLARGIFNEQALSAVHERLKLLLAEQNAYLDRIYYCPYHPEGVIEKFRKDSDWRKPKPGMLIAASKELKIDLKNSWMIGNDYRDIGAGKSAGCKTILVKSYVKPVTKLPTDPNPDFEAINLREAVNIIKRVNSIKPAFVPKLVKNEKPAEKIFETKAKIEEKDIAVEKTIIEEKPAAEEKPKVEEKIIEEKIIVEEKPVVAEQPAVEQTIIDAKPVEVQPEPIKEKEVEPVKIETPQPEPQPEPETVQEGPSAIEDNKPVEKVEIKEEKKTQFIETGSRVETLLEEIKHLIKSKNRSEQYSEFSALKLVAGVLQAAVFFCLIIAIWYKLSPTGTDSNIFTAIGFAIVLQLMALTLLITHKDR